MWVPVEFDYQVERVGIYLELVVRDVVDAVHYCAVLVLEDLPLCGRVFPPLLTPASGSGRKTSSTAVVTCGNR